MTALSVFLEGYAVRLRNEATLLDSRAHEGDGTPKQVARSLRFGAADLQRVVDEMRRSAELIEEQGAALIESEGGHRAAAE